MASGMQARRRPASARPSTTARRTSTGRLSVSVTALKNLSGLKPAAAISPLLSMYVMKFARLVVTAVMPSRLARSVMSGRPLLTTITPATQRFGSGKALDVMVPMSRAPIGRICTKKPELPRKNSTSPFLTASESASVV